MIHAYDTKQTAQFKGKCQPAGMIHAYENIRKIKSIGRKRR